MKLRLPLAMLTLVIVPTVVLSFLAARTLEHDQIVAQDRLENNAAAAIELVVDDIERIVNDALQDIHIEFDDVLNLPRFDGQLNVIADPLEDSLSLVDRIFIFCDPWRKLSWPEPSEIDQGEQSHRNRLLSALQDRVVFGETRRARVTRMGVAAVTEPRIALKVGDSHYVFTIGGSGRDYYVGFRVDLGGLTGIIEDSIDRAAVGGIMLTVEGPGIRVSSAETEGPVFISDSLGERSEVEGSMGDENLLTGNALPAPLGDIDIRAFTEDPRERMRRVTHSKRLFTWCIVLLAAGIIGGAWITIAMAYAELRRAQSGAEFAIGISHDVRTPLASMKMLAESIFFGHVKDADKRQLFLETIVSECDRLSQLIERVLFLVRFGQGVLRYRLQEGDVGLAVRESVGTFLSRYPGGSTPSGDEGPTVEINVDEALPSVMLDNDAFAQVILNLLDNAACYGIKRTNGAPVAPAWIGVSAARFRCRRKPWTAKCEWVRVSVSDKGDGISPQEQKRIFRKYYRVQGTASGNLSGVGLGLAVCRDVAEAHAGWVDVESAPGNGSTFHFYLPTVGADSGAREK